MRCLEETRYQKLCLLTSATHQFVLVSFIYSSIYLNQTVVV